MAASPTPLSSHPDELLPPRLGERGMPRPGANNVHAPNARNLGRKVLLPVCVGAGMQRPRVHSAALRFRAAGACAPAAATVPTADLAAVLTATRLHEQLRHKLRSDSNS